MHHRAPVESYAKMLVIERGKFVRLGYLVSRDITLAVWLQPVELLPVRGVAVLVAIVLKPIHRIKKNVSFHLFHACV